MTNLKSRIRIKLFRRNSACSASFSAASTLIPHHDQASPPDKRSSPLAKIRKSVSSKSLSRHHTEPTLASRQHTEEVHKNEDHPTDLETLVRTENSMSGDQRTLGNSIASYPSVDDAPSGEAVAPELIVQEPTPDTKPSRKNPLDTAAPQRVSTEEAVPPLERKKLLISEIKLPGKESTAARKQSLIANTDAEVIMNLLHDNPSLNATVNTHRPASINGLPTTTAIPSNMLHRKIWVKRPTSAATIVLVREDDMVDEAKDAILLKLKNTLGKHFDAPDVTIRIVSRDGPGERILSPDETICRTLDMYYPGGQSIAEALIIDVPQRTRTPKPSPRANPYAYYYPEETSRVLENATEYFPPMPPTLASPAITSLSHESRHSHAAHERAMSVLNTGQVPPLPSPGGTRRAHISRQSRPDYARTHTSSPTALTSSVMSSRPARPRLDSTASIEKHSSTAPQPPPLSTSPVADGRKSPSNPPTPRVSSPRPSKRKPKTKSANNEITLSLPPGIIDTAVPPINVLIVEDNHINMKLLEQFIRRLKVRWQTAMNGREAVNKWRQGGFHLVLMDIQLPIMSGLEATKEIRRLERVNNIGAFSNTPSDAGNNAGGELEEDGHTHVTLDEDRLGDAGRLFKSPVIIVALTASNLQSDRHEALAAGCNDFLTKVCASIV
jgi:osomolarity two-component system, response regulator SSK1